MFTQLVKNQLTLERYRNGPFAKNGSNTLLIFFNEVTARAG